MAANSSINFFKYTNLQKLLHYKITQINVCTTISCSSEQGGIKIRNESAVTTKLRSLTTGAPTAPHLILAVKLLYLLLSQLCLTRRLFEVRLELAHVQLALLGALESAEKRQRISCGSYTSFSSTLLSWLGRVHYRNVFTKRKVWF